MSQSSKMRIVYLEKNYQVKRGNRITDRCISREGFRNVSQRRVKINKNLVEIKVGSTHIVVSKHFPERQRLLICNGEQEHSAYKLNGKC